MMMSEWGIFLFSNTLICTMQILRIHLRAFSSSQCQQKIANEQLELPNFTYILHTWYFAYMIFCIQQNTWGRIPSYFVVAVWQYVIAVSSFQLWFCMVWGIYTVISDWYYRVYTYYADSEYSHQECLNSFWNLSRELRGDGVEELAWPWRIWGEAELPDRFN